MMHNATFTKTLLLLCLLAATLGGCKPSAVTPAQEKITITTSLQAIDSLLDTHTPDAATAAIVARYKPEMDARMSVVIGQSAIDMPPVEKPESLLSNFTVDALLQIAQQKNWAADGSLFNFGGIRSSLQQGDIRLYDLYTLYPFDNDIIILTIQGKYVRELAAFFATNGVQPMGNVRLVIAGNKVTSISIKGEALDDDRMYRIITNNFVAEGGDGMTMLTKAAVLDRPGVLVRDAMTDYIHWLADNGLLVDAQLDGRVVIVD